MTANDQLTSFSIAREKIVGRVKGSESPSFQVTQSYEEDLIVREKVPSRTERPSVREPGTNGKNAPICQAHNDGSSANSQ